MIVDRRSLAVQEICEDDNERFAIGCVRLEKDGTTVTTDGMLLLAVEPSGLDTDDYPDVGTVEIPEGGVIIPADIAREAVKNMPKSLPHEVLNACAVTKAEPNKDGGDGEIELTTTDLKRTRRIGSPTTGTFPAWKSMLDGVARTKETATITMRISLLEKIVKTLKKIAGTADGVEPYVTLHFRSSTKPIIINGYAGSRKRKFLGLLAPLETKSECIEFNDWQKKLLGVKKIARKAAKGE